MHHSTTATSRTADLEKKWERNSNLQFSKAPVAEWFETPLGKDPPLSLAVHLCLTEAQSTEDGI